jgi:hypothetical protein
MHHSGSELKHLELNHKVVNVRYGHRRQVHRRLQELAINAWCSDAGDLQAEVQTYTDLLQINSVVRQFNAPRWELVGWLEQCWCQE